MYAIIDIETSGLSPKNEKITEIAIYIHDGDKIIDEFVSLINPEKYISPFITRLTGISNEMVENAPKFYEVAKKIVEITDNKIFVAHNVDFDYNFIKTEFERLGYNFQRKKLCTVRLSKKTIPGHKSYSLGKLCDDLNIKINGRHRAAGDALATVKLFELLLLKDGESKPIISQITANKQINRNINKSVLDNLPEKTGVYYFHDEKGNIIYIGKSKNIYKRVISHFNDNSSRRAIEKKNKVADISFEITGSELIALLLESFEIKKHKPLYNRAQRRTANHYGLYYSTDKNAYINFKIEKNTNKNIPLISFNSMKEAEKFAYKNIEKYKLCQKLFGMYDTTGACFDYQVKKCKGACIGEEDNLSYNKRAQKLIDYFDYSHKDFIIIDSGRNLNEKSAIRITNGKYFGFGYFEPDTIGNNIELIIESIKSYPDNRDIQHIIKSFLKQNSVEKILYLK